MILAGYSGRMDSFFASNPGMSSRIAHHLDFPGYSLDELAAIALLMLGEVRYRLSDEAQTTLRDYLSRRMRQPAVRQRPQRQERPGASQAQARQPPAR
ncbi:MAG: hypothetical protein ACRDNF_03895 [Streptosporangiaceae bacterium]